MIKTILISSALGLNIVYPSADICQKALDAVQPQDPKAICLPAGEDKQDQMFSKFFDMVKKFKELEKQEKQKNMDKKVDKSI